MTPPTRKPPLPRDLMDELGPLAFASRAKRLQEKLLRDAGRVYAQFDTDFQPRWFLLFYALTRYAPASVTELAGTLGLSHAAVNQTARELIAAGLVADARHVTDDRKRMLKPTPRGRTLARRLVPLWQDIAESTRSVFAETGYDVIAVLRATEQALSRRNVFQRVAERRGIATADPIHIVPYRPALKKHFYELNREWLETYFRVEPEDHRLLTDPRRRIIGRGGAVLFAEVEGDIAGTCALIRHDRHTYELAKMAVTPAYQGRGIGRRLGEAIIALARERGGRRLILLTSPKLKSALTLYRRLGFKPSPAADDLAAKYARCTIALELPLGTHARRGRRRSVR